MGEYITVDAFERQLDLSQKSQQKIFSLETVNETIPIGNNKKANGETWKRLPKQSNEERKNKMANVSRVIFERDSAEKIQRRQTIITSAVKYSKIAAE